MSDRAESFLSLLSPHREALLVYARRALVVHGDAEDAVQAATLRAFRDFGRFVPGTSFRAFAFAYLVHEVQNANRKRRPSTYGLVPSEEPSIEDDVLAQLEREAAYDVLLTDRDRLPLLDAELAQALRDLSDPERDAFLLRALGELKYAEIAAALQVPLGTVMTRLHRARARLRQALVALAVDRGLLHQGEDRSARREV